MVERGCGVWVGEGDWRVMRGVEGVESRREKGLMRSVRGRW